MEPKREKSCSRRHKFEEKNVLLALRGRLNANRHANLQKRWKDQITQLILRPFSRSFWGPGSIKNRINFLLFFLRVLRATLSGFGRPKGSLGGSLLEVFLQSVSFSRKRWYPRFWTTVQRFGSILRVRSSRKPRKSSKNWVWKFLAFLVVKKKSEDLFF